MTEDNPEELWRIPPPTTPLKCPICGHEHPSIIQMETSDFKTAKLNKKRELCPKCGSVSTYKKSDYFFL